MSFIENFISEKKPIAKLLDGSCMIYAQGRFDAWCIYHVRSGVAHAIKDVEVFNVLHKYAQDVQRFVLYRDFLYVFDKVTNVLNYGLVENIKVIASRYSNPCEIEFLLIFLYAGMVAEENKKNAILKKFIKRLGVHQVLIEKLEPTVAANYSKGKRWQELKLECEMRGFYAYSHQVQLSA